MREKPSNFYPFAKVSTNDTVRRPSKKIRVLLMRPNTAIFALLAISTMTTNIPNPSHGGMPDLFDYEYVCGDYYGILKVFFVPWVGEGSVSGVVYSGQSPANLAEIDMVVSEPFLWIGEDSDVVSDEHGYAVQILGSSNQLSGSTDATGRFGGEFQMVITVATEGVSRPDFSLSIQGEVCEFSTK